MARFEDLRMRVKLLDRSQHKQFLDLAYEGVALLEHRDLEGNDLGGDKPNLLRFPSHLMFMRPPSPAADVFQQIMLKAFHKSLDTRLADDASENNQSGYAIGGHKDVGKTYLLRLTLTLAPLMLDNVFSGFINAMAFTDHNRPLPYQALSKSLGLQHDVGSARRLLAECEALSPCWLSMSSPTRTITVPGLSSIRLRQITTRLFLWPTARPGSTRLSGAEIKTFPSSKIGSGKPWRV
eukprot:m.110330 g.110330  ORF g.110330 m.110330 type:complete len:237 (+) comp16037_c0_seq3:921-1631(+)